LAALVLINQAARDWQATGAFLFGSRLKKVPAILITYVDLYGGRGDIREQSMKKVMTIVAAMVLATSTGAFAATQAANATSVAPTLQIQATIQKAVSLTLATGATAGVSAHCAVAVNGATDYKMDFGTVDALAINGGNCNKFAPVTPGTTNAVYWTDYTILPVYTSHQAFSGTTVTAQVTTDFAAPHNILVMRSATATSSTVPTTATDFAALSTGSADTIGAAGVVSGTALTRFIGVAVTPANSATALQGAQTATVTFTLTVQ
jgi:hypothetical protein